MSCLEILWRPRNKYIAIIFLKNHKKLLVIKTSDPVLNPDPVLEPDPD